MRTSLFCFKLCFKFTLFTLLSLVFTAHAHALSPQELLAKHGKPAIITFILERRNGDISITYPGERITMAFKGKPSEDFISQHSVSHDLHLLGLSPSEVDQALSSVQESRSQNTAHEAGWQRANQGWSQAIYAHFDPEFLRRCERDKSPKYCECVLEHIHKTASGVDIEHLGNYFKKSRYRSDYRPESTEMYKAEQLMQQIEVQAVECGEQDQASLR